MRSSDRRDVQYRKRDDRPRNAVFKTVVPPPAKPDKKAEIKATKPHESGVVYIPLPKALSFIMANSDQQYMDSLGAILGPADKLGTTVRWFGVGHNILYNSTSPGLLVNFMSSNSPEGIATRSLFFAVCVIAGLCNLALEQHSQKEAREEREQAFQNFYRLLAERSKDQESKDSIQKQLKDMLIENIHTFNQYLEKIRLEDKELREKYDSLMIDPEDLMNLSDEDILEENIPTIRMRFKFKDRSPQKKQSVQLQPGIDSKELPQQEPSFWEKTKYYVGQKFCKEIVWNKVLKPIWESGAIITFVWWIAWILASVFTGVQAEHIFGLNTSVALGMTGAFAIPYLGIRLYNYIKHGNGKSWAEFDENARLTHEAEMDAEKILVKAQKRMEFTRDLALIKAQEQSLINELAAKGIRMPAAKEAEGRRTIKGLNAWYESPYLKAAVALTTTSASRWGGVNNDAWWLKVAIETFTMTGLVMSAWNPIAGGVMLLISAGFGVAHMVNRYTESSKLKGDVQAKQLSTSETLEQLQAIYDKRSAYLEQLKRELHSYKNFNYGIELPPSLELAKTELAPQTTWQKVKVGAIKVGQKIRNNTWVDAWDWSMTGILTARLVFTLAAVFSVFALVAVASNPITFGIVVGIGVTYTLMKWYEKRQIKKEQRIKEMPEKLEEVEKQIELAERTKNSYQMSEKLIIESDREREMIAKGCGAEFKPHAVSVAKRSLYDDSKVAPRESKAVVSIDPFELPESSNEWGPSPNAFPAEKAEPAYSSHFFKSSSRTEPQVKKVEMRKKTDLFGSQNWGPDPTMDTDEGLNYQEEERILMRTAISVR